MFDLLLLNLRARGVKVGLGEWLAFLDGLQKGLAHDLDSLYRFGRAMMVKKESQFDDWDLAFKATFDGVELEPELKDQLEEWLRQAVESQGEFVEHDMSPEELRQLFEERLREQQERHDGGSRWIGTGGTSPFGNQGRAKRGMRVGGSGRGNRTAIMTAGERQWRGYRTDRTLGVRDFQVALKAVRSLARVGPEELNLDGTIKRTAENAGDIDLHFERARNNRVHLVLLMDTGGSMTPHTTLVERLFSAASVMKGFKSFTAWSFHNAPYGWLYSNYDTYERQRIDEIIRGWTPQHRLVFVGDASMAPYELFHPMGSARWPGSGGGTMSGLDWLRRMKAAAPASVWLNPDPVEWWDHPTVRGIGNLVPMFPLTVEGLRDAVRRLRTGR